MIYAIAHVEMRKIYCNSAMPAQQFPLRFIVWLPEFAVFLGLLILAAWQLGSMQMDSA